MKIPKLAFGQVVQIDWVDSKSALGWAYNPFKRRTPGAISTIGYVVQGNSECITVTTSVDYRGASIDDFSIPVGCIKDLTIIEDYQLEAKHD